MNSIEQAREAREYVARYGGRCRDCADHDGICPSSGLPCVLEERNKAIDHVIKALNYGIQHGFLSPSIPVDGVGAKPVAWPKIMYVCEYCQENNPEMCGHDRNDLYVTPGGEWLCEGCLDGVGVAHVDCVGPPLLYAAPLASPEAEARLRERVEPSWRAGQYAHPGDKNAFKWLVFCDAWQTSIASGLTKEAAEEIARAHNDALAEAAEAAEARFAQAEGGPASDYEEPIRNDKGDIVAYRDDAGNVGWVGTLKAEGGPAVTEAQKFDRADWYSRVMDPDDSGDTPEQAIHGSMLGDLVVCEIASSFSGPTRFGFTAPVLDPDSDETEFLHFATEQEALEAARERATALPPQSAAGEEEE